MFVVFVTRTDCKGKARFLILQIFSQLFSRTLHFRFQRALQHRFSSNAVAKVATNFESANNFEKIFKINFVPIYNIKRREQRAKSKECLSIKNQRDKEHVERSFANVENSESSTSSESTARRLLNFDVRSTRSSNPAATALFALELEAECERGIDGKARRTMTVGARTAMRESPYAIDAHETEDVFDAEACLDIGFRDPLHPDGEEQRGLRIGQHAVISIRQ